MEKMKLTKQLIFVFLSCAFISSCGNQVREIEPVESNSSSPTISSGIFDGNPNNPSNSSKQVTSVEVLEVLPTDKYVYLRVRNSEEEYWIATRKSEVKVGEKYFYSDALLKTNFESKEFNRIFERIYLVNKIVPAGHGEKGHTNHTHEKNTLPKVNEQIKVDGSTSIAEITANPEKFKGQEIQVSGMCTKINAKIMGTNWIHLDDGSQSDFDFVITSKEAVPIGHLITVKGTLATKKDFGAGYFYDIILENCELIK